MKDINVGVPIGGDILSAGMRRIEPLSGYEFYDATLTGVARAVVGLSLFPGAGSHKRAVEAVYRYFDNSPSAWVAEINLGVRALNDWQTVFITPGLDEEYVREGHFWPKIPGTADLIQIYPTQKTSAEMDVLLCARDAQPNSLAHDLAFSTGRIA